MYPVFSVDIFGTKDRPWEYWDDEWATALTDDQDAFLWYTTPPTRSSRRKLAVRLVNEMQFKPMRDPRLGEYGRVTMNCIAPDPFWYEETSVFDRWRCMVDTTDGHIEWGSVTVSNPTPYPIWIKWRVQDGPLPGGEVAPARLLLGGQQEIQAGCPGRRPDADPARAARRRAPRHRDR